MVHITRYLLHSASRGTGNCIGTYFIEAAKEAIARQRLDFHLADRDLAFLTEGSELFDDYIEAMSFAQDYAMANRELMMGRVLEALRKHLPAFRTDDARGGFTAFRPAVDALRLARH